ncbi:MAG: alpha/beta hydrolase [Oleispira sp.]
MTLLLLFITQHTFASVGGWLFEANRSMEAMIAGLEEKRISVDGDHWQYYVKSSATQNTNNEHCTVLVHGFTAEASHWFRFARNLEHDACIIIPDLPGFGRSSYSPDSDYSITSQVQRLHQFLTQLQLSERYHFSGSSMGGHIAGMYALKYPNEVASLTLIDSGGVSSPAKSEMDSQVEETGKSVFEVESLDDFKKLFAMTLSDPPWMPGVVLDHVSQGAIARTDRHRSIFSQIYQKDLLDDALSSIEIPTLILWGQEDRLLHLSMAETFHQGIAESTLVIIPNAGHLPFLEIPADTADLFNQFISNQINAE